MEDLPPAVAFFPGSIFSKFGFEDGDLLADLLARWVLSRGLSPDEGDWRYVDAHVLLFEAYRRLVELPGWEPVMFVSTSHNPVRARCEWSGEPRVASEPCEDAAPVLVGTGDLLALADGLFPLRPKGWMALHHAVFDLWGFGRPAVDLFGDTDPADELPIGTAFWPTAVDRIVAAHALSEEECLVAARLLVAYQANCAHGPVPPGVLDETVAMCRAVLA